jgi:hypothetical protein
MEMLQVEKKEGAQVVVDVLKACLGRRGLLPPILF